MARRWWPKVNGIGLPGKEEIKENKGVSGES